MLNQNSILWVSPLFSKQEQAKHGCTTIVIWFNNNNIGGTDWEVALESVLFYIQEVQGTCMTHSFHVHVNIFNFQASHTPPPPSVHGGRH